MLIVIGTLFDIDDGSFERALERVVSSLDSDNRDLLASLGGLFTVAVCDRMTGSMQLISDCLGARPCFFSASDETRWASSHAGLLSRTIPGRRTADPIAVSQFLTFGYNASNHSLDPAVPRLGAAEVATCVDKSWNRDRYDSVFDVHASIGADEMAERIHAVVSRSYRNWARQGGALVLGLSGGFDSRYLAALSASNPSDVRYVNISNMQAETTMARRVSDALELPLEVVMTQGPEWSHYAPESAFHLRPDGLPVTKSVCRLVARAAPDRRVVDGYLGDALIRGHLDGLLGTPEANADGDVVARILDTMVSGSQWVLAREPQQRVIGAAKRHATLDIDARASRYHIITTADIFLRQRCYIANNFLQNSDTTEPCLPFLDPELIRLKRSYPHEDFGIQTYQAIFRTNYPRLLDMPHSKSIATRKDQLRLMSRRSTVSCLIDALALKRGGPIDQSRVIPRVAMALVQQRQSYIPQSLAFWMALETSCELHGLDLDLGAVQ